MTDYIRCCYPIGEKGANFSSSVIGGAGHSGFAPFDRLILTNFVGGKLLWRTLFLS